MNGETERELERKMRAYRRDALGFVGFVFCWERATPMARLVVVDDA